MYHQDEILNEKRPEPLDLGHRILSAAFEAVGLEIPDWFNERLPENQLEESLQDNDVIVKRAFEKYIDEQFNKNLQIWKSQLGKDDKFHIPDDISDRLLKLAQTNVLPDIKYTKNWEVIIRKGILTELYNYGVTKDQLPNLKALADYMKARYGKHVGNNVVFVSNSELTKYFDENE